MSRLEVNRATEKTARPPAWRRWLTKLAAIEEALSLSIDEIQDRRIARLEAEVAELASVACRSRGGAVMSGNSFVHNATGRVVKYIKPVPRGEAEGLVASVYKQAEKEFALVPPITLHSQAPEVLAAVFRRRCATHHRHGDCLPLRQPHGQCVPRALAKSSCDEFKRYEGDLRQNLRRAGRTPADSGRNRTRRNHWRSCPTSSCRRLRLGARQSRRLRGACALASTIVAAGRRAVPASVRASVEDAISRWNGGNPGLAQEWIDEAVGTLPTAVEQALARLCFLTALASYRVDQTVVNAYRSCEPNEAHLIAVTAWASLAAVTRPRKENILR